MYICVYIYIYIYLYYARVNYKDVYIDINVYIREKFAK